MGASSEGGRVKSAPPRILILAGEASGDDHGAGVARALKRRLAGVRLTGLGGPRMRAEGADLMADLDQLAVMGFVEVVRHLGFFRGLLRRVVALLDAGAVDLVIAVDTSVAHLAGALGKPVWVMLPMVPDFRWRMEGAETPWYPTMRLFRRRPGEGWEPVAPSSAAEVAPSLRSGPAPPRTGHTGEGDDSAGEARHH